MIPSLDVIPVSIPIVRLVAQLQRGGKHQPHGGHQEHANGNVAGANPQLLHLPLQPPDQATQAKDEQKIHDHTAQKRQLHDPEIPRSERRRTDEKLGRVAKGGVEEGSEGVVGVFGDLFGDEGETLGAGNERESREEEAGRFGDDGESGSEEGDGSEDEEDVQFGVEE